MNPVSPYHGDRFDGDWASEWVQADGIERIRFYDRLVRDRLLRVVGDPSEEAEKARSEYWDERMSEVADPENADPADFVDAALDRAIETYEMLSAVQQSVLNLCVAGLFHLFEQTCTSLGRAWMRKECESVDEWVHWLRVQLSLDPTHEPFWSVVRELRLVTNVIKHGEGSSAKKLRKINPAIFDLPGVADLRDTGYQLPVVAPLSGGDLYATESDYSRYCDGVLSFWNWLDIGVKGRHGELHGE